MTPWTREVFGRPARFWAACALLLIPLPGSAEKLEAIRSNQPNTVLVPIAVMSSPAGKAVCSTLALQWTPGSENGDDALTIEVDSSSEGAANNLRAQLWISSLASALASQQPWTNAGWKVQKAPAIDGPSVGAALGLGMIAASARLHYPQDTLVIGSLNPDGSLGMVSDVFARIEAAANAGFKRVVLPDQQRVEATTGGALVNVESRARALGLECILVNDLTEATEKVLNARLPSVPILDAPPRSEGALASHLDANCQRQLTELQADSPQWPRTAEELAKQKPPQQLLWKHIVAKYDPALDTYRSGRLYAAWLAFEQLLAEIAAARAWPQNSDFSFRTADSNASITRDRIAKLLNEPALDRNDLQTGLVLAEQGDWLSLILARVEGGQALIRQAFGPRSDATTQQRELAKNALQTALAEAEYHLKQADFYSGLDRALPQGDPVRAAGRATLWLPQLVSAQLASAEFLSEGLKGDATRFRESLLFDPQLATQARSLRQAKEEQEQREQERLRQLRREAPQTNQVGFAPGAVYSPPKPPAPPPSAPKLSDTTRCLRWVNDYCQLSALELKYLRLGGAFDPASLQWKIQNRGALQSMLQSAEIGARRGMAMAEKVGVPAAMLGLIDENASALAASSDDEDRLEALRQYWRCALLGNLAWQLGSPAAAVKPPEPKPEEQPAAEPAEKAPEQQAPPAPKPKARDQEKPKEPEAVPALPVSPEELDRDQQMQDQTDSGE